jgi:NAD+ synthase (glutamine-hydrolysing)
MALRIMLAQMNSLVGDLKGNQKRILEIAEIAKKNKIDLLVFPEMSISGYPIQDLIYDYDFYESEQQILNEIAIAHPDLNILVGGFGIEQDPDHHPEYQNVAFFIKNKKIQKRIQKRLLPTYGVFDEKRYFWAGNEYDPIEVEGIKLGVAICEDLWDADYSVRVAEQLVEKGAELIIGMNASPYVINKQKTREKLVIEKAKKFNVPIFYLNLIGGQDELVFDGRSFIVDKTGNIVSRAVFCEEQLIVNEFNKENKSVKPVKKEDLIIPSKYLQEKEIIDLLDINEEIVQALSMNLRDYYNKVGIFKGIVLGLSGGVDSAFTAYIAYKAVGKENVMCLLMPSKYSSKGSIDDSIELCNNLGIRYLIVPIKESHGLLEPQLQEIFTDKVDSGSDDLACQNLQARLRGTVLMFYSNKYHYLLASTGNKSEVATGYCTLYGDTNGGKNIPGDLYKTQLYEVCNWINREKEIMPQNIITKPPSAELKEDQIDEDNLPPYAVLDEILKLRLDEGLSPRQIIAKGKDKDLVYRIEKLITNSEFKRAQLAQTIKINKKTFGMGRKIPVLKKSTY